MQLVFLVALSFVPEFFAFEREKRQSACSTDTEYTCSSGQCIDAFSVCDGNSDCYDGTDETITQCINVKCPLFSFQCAYGGCIDGSKKCNKVEDCKDGSDEDSEQCQRNQTAVDKSSPTNIGNSCRLPEKPKGGDYMVVGCRDGDRSAKCRRVPGTIVNEQVIIQFFCHDGFVLPEDKKNSFCFGGIWDPEPPECLKLCPSVESSSVDLTCSYLGKIVKCNQPARPGTKLRAKCKPAFHIVHPNDEFIVTECFTDGKWANELFTCNPDCGIKNKEVRKLIHNAPEVHSEYPWHAALYIESGQKYICGGTIIHPKAILTAAHCVYNESLQREISPKDLVVAVGKFNRSWDAKDNNEQRFTVLEILTQENYVAISNRYEQDIAILAINDSISVTPSVMPVCLDRNENQYELYKNASSIGTVVGWGITENNTLSDVLRIGHYIFLDFHSCRQKVAHDFSVFITYDKFCAIPTKGTSLDQGDSGGGLTFPLLHNNVEVHFLYGIVSLNDASSNALTTFTNVTVHIGWIEKVLNAIKKRKS